MITFTKNHNKLQKIQNLPKTEQERVKEKLKEIGKKHRALRHSNEILEFSAGAVK